ncbi:MAG: hypothetical protein K2Q32_09330 [Alphaproteobacteria bacterium]|nr:hypothetical protein [Alphaproteobacteria bacterium]
MSLSRQTVSSLIDLIEIKLSCMTVQDRDDLREKVALQKAMCELSALTGGAAAGNDDEILGEVPRRGRRRRIFQESAGSYA